MTDWIVWPIFLFQGFTFILLLFSKETRLCGVQVKTYAVTCLLLICVAIVVSLYHDSTDVLTIHL